MLDILNINPTGYYSFGIHETIKLDQLGLVLLEGKNNDRSGNPNGAGKTSLFNALTSILFDKNPLGISGEAIVNEKLGKSFGKVGFLDKNGTAWRVIVTRKWRKTDKYPDAEFDEPSEWLNHGEKYSGTDVYLERWDRQRAIWVDERGTNNPGDARLELKATRQKLLVVLGVTYDQFMAVGYLAQQQSMRFINGTHKERMQVIADLGDISIWDKRRDKIKEKIKIVESEIDRLHSIVIGANKAGGIVQKPNPNDKSAYENIIEGNIREAQWCLNKIAAASEFKAGWLQGHAVLDELISTKMTEQRTLAVQRQSITNSINKCVRDQTDEFRRLLEKPKDAELANLEIKLRETRGIISTRKWDLEQLLPGSGRCPRCRSLVTDEHLLRQKELFLAEIRELEALTVKLNEEIKLSNEKWEQASQRDIAELNARYDSIKSDLDAMACIIDASINAVDASIAQARNNKLSLGPDPELKISSLSMERMGYLAALSQAEEKLRDWDRQESAWTEFNKIIESSKNDIVSLEDELKYLRILERMFGDKGIKAHKLSVILAQLNHLVQKFLDILTDGAVNVHVSPFREKTDGSLSADIQIMVKEGEKTDVPFDLYSGGEKQQIVLAFIGAFWQVASLQGSGVNLLCLDEIFGPLDDQNAVGVYNYLEYIKSQGKSTILITTHSNEVKNQLNFNKVWVVEKTNHTSHLRS
jgi:DNA repair exonuclease SbcCD ATPase subunit